jgi:choline dehydrogenase-like flavoprotein
MEITSPARAEFFAGLPYSGRANLSLIRHLLPSMIGMQLFLPQRPESCARLSLTGGDRLRIQGTASPPDPARTAPLLSFMRRLGAWTSQRLIVRVPTGHAIHYAGTLPMSDRPGRYQCHPDGRLAGTRGVFVADSATLPVLPAKNMSFGMMANAMRVATQAAIATRERA